MAPLSDDLYEHMLTDHKLKILWLKCIFTVKDKETLEFHNQHCCVTIDTLIKNMEQETVYYLKCSDCDFTCLTTEALNVHFSQNHDTGDGFSCELCHETFGRGIKLKEHRLLHHGINPFKNKHHTNTINENESEDITQSALLFKAMTQLTNFK